MDVEKTIKFMLDAQARHEATLDRVGELQVRLAEDLGDLTRIVKQIAQENERAHQRFQEALEEARRRDEEAQRRHEEAGRENAEAHRRFDEQHRDVEERFNFLIKMMDEWIRRQKNGGS